MRLRQPPHGFTTLALEPWPRSPLWCGHVAQRPQPCSPSPPRGWLLGPGDNTLTAPTSSEEPKEVAGPGCVPRYLLVEVAPEGLLGHNTGGHLPTPQRAHSLFNKSLTLPHSQSDLLHHDLMSPWWPWHGEAPGKEGCPARGSEQLVLPSHQPAEPHSRGAGATRSCPGGPALRTNPRLEMVGDRDSPSRDVQQQWDFPRPGHP